MPNLIPITAPASNGRSLSFVGTERIYIYILIYIYICIYIYVYLYIYIYIYTANIYDNLTCEQSRKLQVHGKDIHKFGKVPSLATCLHKMMYMANVWQTCGVSLKGRQNVCGPLFSKLRRGLLAAIAANGNVSICTLW